MKFHSTFLHIAAAITIYSETVTTWTVKISPPLLSCKYGVCGKNRHKTKSCSYYIQTQLDTELHLLQQLLSKLQIMYIPLKWQLTVWPNNTLSTSSKSIGTHTCWSKCPRVHLHKARYTWNIVRWEFTVHQVKDCTDCDFQCLDWPWHLFISLSNVSCEAEWVWYFTLPTL